MGLNPPAPVSCQVWDWLGKSVAVLLVLLTAESVLGLALRAGPFT